MDRIAHVGWDERSVRTDLGPCYEWRGSKGPANRARVHLGGNKYKYVARIILAHTLGVDELDDGLLACHHCDNPPCVNPAHLFAGSVHDNNADMVQKERQANGERSNTCKLTDTDVAEMRSTFTGAYGQVRALALQYGVSQWHVSNVVHGRSRKVPTRRKA